MPYVPEVIAGKTRPPEANSSIQPPPALNYTSHYNFKITYLSAASSGKLQQARKAMKAVDQFLAGQESLQQLNPLMKAMGEPVFVLLPTLMQGLIQNWELSLEQHRVNRDDKPGEGADGAESYDRFHLYVDFPSLGPIQIDGAHRPKELLLSLTLTDEEATDFVDSYLPQLERAIRDLGYHTCELITRTGTPTSCKPD